MRYVLPGSTLRVNTNAPLTYVLDETFFSLQVPVSFMLGPDETLTEAQLASSGQAHSRFTSQWIDRRVQERDAAARAGSK